jgi:hypothetical protein
MRASHRQIRARFIQKDEPARIYRRDPRLERDALGVDARTIVLGRPGSFFLNTYPSRCNARKMLERCTRAVEAARPLYARVNSSVVRSGRSWITARSSGTSTGEVHPPLLAKGSSVPVARCRRTQRWSVGSLTEKRSATATYVSVPDSYARTARSRNSVGYGFGHVRNRSQLVHQLK